MFPHLTVSTTHPFPPLDFQRFLQHSLPCTSAYTTITNCNKTSARCDFVLPRASPHQKQTRDKQHRPNQQTNQSQPRREPAAIAPPNQQHQQSTQKPRQQPCFHCQLCLDQACL